MAAPKAGPQLPPGYTLPSAADGDGLDRSIYQDGTGDSRGYYHDGAYTAAPDYPSSASDEDSFSPDPAAANRAALAESYFAALTARFSSLRTRLRQPPPQSVLDALPPEHETEVSSFARGKPTFRTWTHRMRYTDPLPAQVAAMDKVSVLRLLRVVMGAKFFRRGCALRTRTSRWIWALLARLPDPGEMDSDEVGAVRELGKRAVLVSISREHVAALCEVLGREQVVAFGLNGVLHEIEGRVGEREVDMGEEDGDGAGELEGDGRYGNDDEIPLSPESDDQDVARDASEALANGTQAAVVNTDHDLEDGELPEEDEVAVTPRAGSAEVDTQNGGETDMDIEEGEVSNEPSTDAALQAMKAKLLSDLDNVDTWEAHRPPTPPAAKTPADDDVSDLVNMRATVNMILTVAGEFYGQRDLLAFRDPFGGVPFEENGDD